MQRRVLSSSCAGSAAGARGVTQRPARSATRLARDATGGPPRPVSAHGGVVVNNRACGRTNQPPAAQEVDAVTPTTCGAPLSPTKNPARARALRAAADSSTPSHRISLRRLLPQSAADPDTLSMGRKLSAGPLGGRKMMDDPSVRRVGAFASLGVAVAYLTYRHQRSPGC